MFGSLQVDVNGKQLGVGDFGGRKPKQVFEILLCHRGHAVAKDRIADQLWGEALPQDAIASLETYVSVLRRRLGTRAGGNKTVVITEPGSYRIAQDEVDVDLDRFDSLLHQGGRAGLIQALELARGDLLEDEPYGAWASDLREIYRQRRTDALLDLAEESLAIGDHCEALSQAENAIAAEPTRERGYRLSMLARYALGRQDEALRAFERCRVALAEHLGVHPLPQTVELQAAIVRHDHVGSLLPSPGYLRPQGLSRLPATLPVARIPLLGRVEELVALQRHCEAALAGDASVVLVHGEAGIGKTRLVDELLARLPGIPVGRSKCFELGSDLPFVALAEAVRSLGGVDRLSPQYRADLGEILPELGPPGSSPQAARTRAFESLAALIRARAPLVLFIDDLQWADASTVAALAFLVRRCSAVPVVILGALRGDEAGPDHPAHALQADFAVELGPLESGDLAPLGIDRLYEQTAGHPLFLVERLRAGTGDPDLVPETLRDLVLTRCRTAGPQGHRILAAASVVGRSFDPVVLARMLDSRTAVLTEELEELCRRRLLRVVGMRFDFRHDLVRDALLTSLSPARRRALHARALEALERVGADDGTLAHHAEEAEAWERSLRYSLTAADSAEAHWANVEAVAHLERAHRCLARAIALNSQAGEALLVRLGRLLVKVGRTQEAEHLLSEARVSAESRKDDLSLFEALDGLTAARHRGAGCPSGALAHANSGLEVAHRAGDMSLLSRSHIALANASGSLGMLQQAVDHCRVALGLAEETGSPPPALASARISLVMHHWARDIESLAWSERSEAAALEQRDEETLVMSRWIRALSCAALGRYQESWSALDSIGRIGHGEEVFWHARVPNTYGSILSDLCLYERALDRDTESLDAARSSVLSVVREAELQTVLNVATDQLGLGRLIEARASLEFVRSRTDEVEDARFRYLSRLHFLDAQASLEEGNPENALAAASRCLDMARRHDLPKYEVRGRLARGRSLAALGDAAGGLAEIREAASLADRLGYAGLSWPAWWTAFTLSRAEEDCRRAQAGVAQVVAALGEPLRTQFLQAVPVGA